MDASAARNGSSGSGSNEDQLDNTAPLSDAASHLRKASTPAVALIPNPQHRPNVQGIPPTRSDTGPVDVPGTPILICSSPTNPGAAPAYSTDAAATDPGDGGARRADADCRVVIRTRR